MLSESESNSMVEHLNKSQLEREKTTLKLKAVIGKEDCEMRICDILWIGQCSCFCLW